MVEETEKMEKEDKTGMPVKQEIFLEAGMHIGTKIRTCDMRDFVFKRRDDGLYILDLRKSAGRLLLAAKLISRYKTDEVLVVASRVYSSNPASKFSLLTGIPLMKGRFVPGTMTNRVCKNFREPKIVLVCDPKGEKEAIQESAKNGVPIIALCDTDNETKFVDLIVPINNKGKRSLALTFYILAREIMLSQGKINDYSEFRYDVGYFEQPLPEEIKKDNEAQDEPIELPEEKVVAVAAEQAGTEESVEAAKQEKPKETTEKKQHKKQETKADEPAEVETERTEKQAE